MNRYWQVNHQEYVMKKIRITLFTFMACLSLFGCSTTPTKNAGFTALGQASFYADKFENRKTASGELYQQDKHTAAHRSLAFGTKVKVTNTENGDSVVVRINDRGPFIRGRIIDLSQSAFSQISHTRSGVINVVISLVP